jgi:Dockerin type I domain
MNQSKELRRVHRRTCPVPELLEDRMVLSAGEGSTFAIMPGSVTTSGQVSTINFKIDPTDFTSPKKNGNIVIGIDIAPATPTSASTSAATTPTLKPEIVSVTDALTGRVIRAQHTRYDRKVAKADKLGSSPTSAVLVTLKVPATGQPATNYSVQVKGLNQSTGGYLIGFYLPGDVAGTGTVTKTDIQTIKKDHGMTAQSSNYSFDADVNRDGIINNGDVKIAREDLGASTKISPVVSVNLDPASNPKANRTTTFSTVHFAGVATPGATVTFLDQSGGSKTTATADSTGAYSIMVPLVSGSNTFTVTTQDGFGQSITGAITPVVYSPTSS